LHRACGVAVADRRKSVAALPRLDRRGAGHHLAAAVGERRDLADCDRLRPPGARRPHGRSRQL